jgi:molybdate transport repressor ModE-like protein
MQGLIGLEDLRLVHAIAAEGTLTGAARRLGVDHSTAFRRLGTLEKRLGVRLFERARDGYAPTLAGEAAIVTATRFDRELSDLERRIAGEDLRPSGPVRVTTTDTLLNLVSPIFATLRAEQPGIIIEVATGNEFFTLTRRDADVAIRPAASVPDGLVARCIATVATAFYASRTYIHVRRLFMLGGRASETSETTTGWHPTIRCRISPRPVGFRPKFPRNA